MCGERVSSNNVSSKSRIRWDMFGSVQIECCFINQVRESLVHFRSNSAHVEQSFGVVAAEQKLFSWY